MIGPTMPRREPGGVGRPWTDDNPAGPAQMSRDLAAHPEVEEALHADTFVGRVCTACGGPAMLRATPIMFSACPRCLAERLRRLLATRDGLPWWVTYLAETSERHAAEHEAQTQGAPTVRFDPFFKCTGCGKLLTQKEARYWSPKREERSLVPPYCQSCVDRLRAGERP